MTVRLEPIEAYRVRGTLTEVAAVLDWLGDHLPGAEVSEFNHTLHGCNCTVLLKTDADVVTFKLMWSDDIADKPAQRMTDLGELKDATRHIVSSQHSALSEVSLMRSDLWTLKDAVTRIRDALR